MNKKGEPQVSFIDRLNNRAKDPRKLNRPSRAKGMDFDKGKGFGPAGKGMMDGGKSKGWFGGGKDDKGKGWMDPGKGWNGGGKDGGKGWGGDAWSGDAWSSKGKGGGMSVVQVYAAIPEVAPMKGAFGKGTQRFQPY